MSAADVATAAVDERVQAPFGRRSARVVGNRESGGYRVFSALDTGNGPPAPKPRAGQFYMLTAERGWGGRAGERPYLPRAFSVAAAESAGEGVRLDFLVESVGPGTERLAGLEDGEELLITGPLGKPFSGPSEINSEAAGAILVGGGIGAAPLAIWRRELVSAGVATRTLLGFRDRAHSGGTELFGISNAGSSSATEISKDRSPSATEISKGRSPSATSCSEVRLASEDGHTGHRGYVTDLLAVLLEGEDAARSAAVYACGPPGMLEAVRAMCAARGVACELAMETPMGCGFGGCFGCAVPLAGGGFMRLCVDGPVVRGEEIETALVAGSGHR